MMRSEETIARRPYYDRTSPLQRHFWAGALLVSVFWPLNWMWSGMRTHVLFFPLWLGYILIVDAVVAYRKGHSLLTRSPKEFLLLFAISAPVWWLFELINWRTQNWSYQGGDLVTGAMYVLLATINFSTVMPAVFGTSELIRTFRWTDRFAHFRPVAVTKGLCRGFFFTGLGMLVLLLAFPRYFYPFVWTSLVLLMEPLSVRMGRKSILSGLSRGDWSSVAALSAGVLVCGFFWELWNYYSYPKWVYDVPFFGFWHIFEMPLLGYLGYVPFALELYVIIRLVRPGLRLEL